MLFYVLCIIIITKIDLNNITEIIQWPRHIISSKRWWQHFCCVAHQWPHWQSCLEAKKQKGVVLCHPKKWRPASFLSIGPFLRVMGMHFITVGHVQFSLFLSTIFLSLLFLRCDDVVCWMMAKYTRPRLLKTVGKLILVQDTFLVLQCLL